MTNYVDPTGGARQCCYGDGASSNSTLAAFVSSVADGGDLEALLTQDASSMRRLKLELSRLRSNIQWQLVKSAADKIRRASWQGLYSAVLGAGVQVAASVYTSLVNPAPGDIGGKIKCTIANAVARGASSYNVFTMKQAESNAQSQELGQAASMQGQLAASTQALVDAARKLEQAMIRHLEKMADSEDRTTRSITDRIG